MNQSNQWTNVLAQLTGQGEPVLPQDAPVSASHACMQGKDKPTAEDYLYTVFENETETV